MPLNEIVIRVLGEGLNEFVREILDTTIYVDANTTYGYNERSRIDAVGSTLTVKFSGTNLTCTFQNVELHNCDISIASTSSTNTVIFSNCILHNVNFTSNGASIRFDNCNITFCSLDSAGATTLVDSVAEYCVFDSAVTVKGESFVNFCSATAIITVGDDTQAVYTNMSSCTVKTLNIVGKAIATNVIVTDNLQMSGSKNNGVVVIHRTEAILASDIVSLNNCTFSSLICTITHDSTATTTNVFNIQNSNDITITVNGELRQGTNIKLANFVNSNRVAITGDFQSTGLANPAVTANSSSVIRVVVFPVTYKIARFTAGVPATSHTVNTGLLGNITHLFIQPANTASLSYNSLSVIGNSFTIEYAIATSADIYYEAYTAIFN